jgi:hypothetical protein
MLKLSSALHAESSHRMTKLHKIYWVVHNIANALAPAVTVLYWSLVYDSREYIFCTNKFGHAKISKNSADTALADGNLASRKTKVKHKNMCIIKLMDFSAPVMPYKGCNAEEINPSV